MTDTTPLGVAVLRACVAYPPNVDALLTRGAAGLLNGAAKVDESTYAMLLDHVTGDPWPDPEPVHGSLPSLPDEALYGVMAPHVRATAAAVQVAPEMVYLADLTVAATVTRGRYRVQVTSEWSEDTGLYSMTVAESGERKSAVVERSGRPAVEADRRIRDVVSDPSSAYAQRLVDWQTEKALADREKADAERALKAAESDTAKRTAASDLARVVMLLDRLERERPKPPPAVFVDDITPESLTSELADRGALGVLTAEGGLIGLLGGRYSDSPNLDTVHKAYSREPLIRDRVDSTKSLYHPRPFLCVGLVVQPDVVREMLGKREMRSRGFVQRFLYLNAPTVAGGRSMRSSASSAGAQREWEQQVERLAAACAEHDPTDRDSEVVLTLTDAALDALESFYTDHEARLGDGGDLQHVKGWANRLPGFVVRIAAVHAVLENPTTTVVDLRHLQPALSVAPVLVAHAQALLSARYAATPEGHALRIIERLLADGVEVTTRAVTQQARDQAWCGREAGAAERVREVLRSLEVSGWVRRRDDGQRGRGRPSEVWDTHPTLRSDGTPSETPNNPFGESA